MKLNIVDITKKKVGEVDLPQQFQEDIRPDLLHRAVLAIKSNNRKAYGAKPGAGMRASADLSKRRRKYRGMYGFGISRTPRKILSRRGTRMYWVGAVSPNTVGGRKAHPPKAEKNLSLKINKKERRKAIRAGISATVNKDLVVKRGHKVPEDYPFILDDKFEDIKKTKNIKIALIALGLEKELSRLSKRKIRAGKGKARGRKYNAKKGPLMVVSKMCNIIKAADNILGFDIVKVKDLNAELLAPGESLGRLTLWSEAAIKSMEKDKLLLK